MLGGVIITVAQQSRPASLRFNPQHAMPIEGFNCVENATCRKKTRYQTILDLQPFNVNLELGSAGSRNFKSHSVAGTNMLETYAVSSIVFCADKSSNAQVYQDQACI